MKAEEQTVDKETMLKFAYDSISRVSELEKRASVLEGEKEDLRKERDDYHNRLKTAESDIDRMQRKQANSLSLSPERVSEISQLLSESGLVKVSASELENTFRSNPDSVLDTLENFLNLGGGEDEGNATSMKTASQRESNDPNHRWRMAGKQQ